MHSYHDDVYRSVCHTRRANAEDEQLEEIFETFWPFIGVVFV